MADSEEDDEPRSVKERMRMFETGDMERSPMSTGQNSRPPPGQRSLTTPVKPTIRRPPLSQFSSTSEEIIQKTKSSFLDLTEKGKATFQQAGTSVTDFKDRLMNQKKNTSEIKSPRAREPSETSRLKRVSSDDLIIMVSDESSDDDEDVRSRSYSNPDTQMVEEDRKELESQISQHFANLKLISQSAISTVSNATAPLVEGAKSGFDAASRNTSELWQSSNAKVIADKMSEDLRDYANHTKGSMGLCSKCEKFPREGSQKSETGTSDVEHTFETPLERILYHSDWCRLCGFFLRNLCRPEYDPFRHPQVGPYLQPHLKGLSFGHFVDSGQRYTDAHWPFGYGKELHEGAFNYLDPVSLRHRYKKQAVTASAHLIPMMMKVATGSTRSNAYSPLNARARRKQIVNSAQRQYQKETAYENLVHPLECVLKVTIRTSADPLKSGQVQATLLGYGRGFGAQMTTLSRFSLRVQAEPSYGSPTLPLRYGNLVDSGQIDLSLGAMWLHECEANHGSHCSEQSWSDAVQAPPNLRVIDVQQNYVVSAPTTRDFRFVALSYVWGMPAFETLKLTGSNLQQLTQKNGLTEYWHGIPATVKDAISVVRAMGERYLWVDALCIVQDVNDEEKHHEIAAMDWIYSKALFTIVAADAQTSMSGLGGVRPASRNLKQHAVQVRAGTRLLIPIDAPRNLDESVWNSRAWTFQERLLSRRLLIFQGGQMLWHCRSSIAHEDMTPADKGIDYPALPWLTLRKQLIGTDGKVDGSIMVFPDQSTHIVRSETFRQYARLVEQYTHRQLTNDEDILNALGGLLHIFRQFFKFPMRYGLPEILFDIALLWQPAEMLEVRHSINDSKFPSWSWAGWKGKVKYEEPFYADVDQFLGTLTRVPLKEAEYRREERIRPLIRWYFKNKSNAELALLNKSGLGIPIFSKGKDLPEEWEKTPFEDDNLASVKSLDLPQGMLVKLESHHLVFQTSGISTFSLGKPLHQESDTSFNPHNPPLRFNILNSNLKNVGTVLIDGEGPHRLNERHEFIVISEAQYYGLDFEPGKVEGYPLYVVMLVEWREVGEGKVARRLGLGRVNKLEWRKGGPTRKIVCLE